MSADKLEHYSRDFDVAIQEFESTASSNLEAVEQLRLQFLGKKGVIGQLYDLLRIADGEDKKTLGQKINNLRVEWEEKIQALAIRMKTSTLAAMVEGSKNFDISLPGERSLNQGSLHPVSLVRTEILRVFRSMGFAVWDGPEIDFDRYNFSALNFPDDHPARDMQDTFFVESAKETTVLRTHTSNVQIHAMLSERPPLRFVAPGRTFRCDNDQTHTPMFHQIEAVVVDRDISMGHLKGVIEIFLRELFGPKAAVRLRPSFFPFVEPGAEVDMGCVVCDDKSRVNCRVCKGTGWLEIGGCGMIHPNVFEGVKIDSEDFTGFAFGFGLDRMAMLKFGTSDLRLMFETDLNYLSSFPTYFLSDPVNQVVDEEERR